MISIEITGQPGVGKSTFIQRKKSIDKSVNSYKENGISKNEG